MEITANNPNRTSWVDVPENSDFPIQNLPFGVFSTTEKDARVGVALGEHIIDMYELASRGYLGDIIKDAEVFNQDKLNPFMKLGRDTVRAVRNELANIFDSNNAKLESSDDDKAAILVKQSSASMHMPVQVGDYTDFYSSKEHATNVGKMFRDPDNALLPNWLHIPVGYHGRASSIIVSGTPIHRPKGQTKPDPDQPPVFGPSKRVDFELEMAFVTYDGKALGDSISSDEAEDYIFGMCLFNDWSARDMQKWEYVPLGPFLAKSFASSVSPWIVTMDALEPYRCAGPQQDPEPLPYLKTKGDHSFDINLEVGIKTDNTDETKLAHSNFKYMYWSMAQQLAHHTVNGCNIRVGDMMASGTISGKESDEFGSMLELTWSGKNPIKLPDGSERKFIEDGDTVIMRGYSEKDGIRIGFGEVRSKVLPAK
ncbi:fumarylacetoacetase [Salibacter halophilus]|uniref:fumarylacetoacetase n=1 Tax=Salibacter halophilus TaxID=1803916 RepID=A0A6N6M563_9FLAO|nr:fumarylacetoacetase [Salibacter halophilus]KAB1064757.1 fumarylacetoacetase [Salibacter halophilus]